MLQLSVRDSVQDVGAPDLSDRIGRSRFLDVAGPQLKARLKLHELQVVVCQRASFGIMLVQDFAAELTDWTLHLLQKWSLALPLLLQLLQPPLLLLLLLSLMPLLLLLLLQPLLLLVYRHNSSDGVAGAATPSHDTTHNRP